MFLGGLVMTVAGAYLLTNQVVVTSGHDVASKEPDVLVDEILKVMTAARAS